jgi:lysyl-tRNA synthetase class 2
MRPARKRRGGAFFYPKNSFERATHPWNFQIWKKSDLKKCSACARRDGTVSNRAHPTQTTAAAIEEFKQAETAAPEDTVPEVKAILAGRLRSMRPMGKVTFAHIEDGSGRIQFILSGQRMGAERWRCLPTTLIWRLHGSRRHTLRTKTAKLPCMSRFSHAFQSPLSAAAAKDEVVDGQVVPTRFKRSGNALPRTLRRPAVNPEVRDIFRVRAGVVRAIRNYG